MSGLQEYSTTPGTNSTINSINIAEGCPYSTLNNAIRQLLADLRSYANDAQWFQYGDADGTATVAHSSATAFTIAGADVTATWHAGRRVKVVAATPGTIYGTISSSSFSTNTTVNVTWDSGSLSNEALTAYLGAPSYSNTSVPPQKLTNIEVSGGTATTTVDPAADSLVLHDDSASANRKVLVRYVAPVEIGFACSDETTAITAGTAKIAVRLPMAITLTNVFATLTAAQASGSIFTVDINESGTTILSTKLTIDNGEETSATAVTPAVISDAAIAAQTEITVDVDQIGNSTAKGLKVWLVGYRT